MLGSQAADFTLYSAGAPTRFRDLPVTGRPGPAPCRILT